MFFFNESNRTIFRFSSIVKDDVDIYKKELEERAVNGSLFSQYYQIRQPIFDYFKKVFFFPFKHCVYANKFGSHEIWALEAIIQTIEGEHSTDDDIVQRETVFNCGSSVVKDWAKGKDLELKDEIGFIGVKDSYFLDRREEDIKDEISVFKPIESSVGKKQSIWSMILNNLLLILLEPNFRYEMRKEWLNYIKVGVDPNFYRNQIEKEGGNKEGWPIPRRPISYEIDLKLGTLYTRMKRYIDLQTAIFKHTTDFNLRQEITNDISCRLYTFPEFYQYTESLLSGAFESSDESENSKESVSNFGKTQFIQENLIYFKENKADLPPDNASDIAKFFNLIAYSEYVYRVDEKK